MSETATAPAAAEQAPAENTGQQDTQQAPEAPKPAPPPSAPQTRQEPASEPEQPKGNVWDDPATARAEIERLRRENGASRTNAKAQAADEARTELAQQIGKALGLVTDEQGKPDPDKLIADLTGERDTERATTKALKAENATLKAAAQHGADPLRLVDSRKFMAALDKLDPAADDYDQQVSDAIAKAVEDNPTFKAAGQAPRASSVDHAGGSGEGAVTKEQFDRMSYGERAQLFEKDPALYRRLAAGG